MKGEPGVLDSFELWMAVEGPKLKRAAILLCRDEHEADDLVQETLVRVYVRWAKICQLANPEGYAQRTLTNVYLSRLRRVRVDRAKGHLFMPAETTADQITAAADRSALNTWLRALGKRQRATVVWRYYADLSIPEIASLMGCREATVRTQLSRALTTMRRVAEQDECGPSPKGARRNAH